jgi:alpha-glucosidase
MQYLSKVPDNWDETQVFDGQIARFVTMAKRNGDTWYVAGMNDWSERTVTLDFGFLGEGEYDLQLYSDGRNADRNGTDYRMEHIAVKKGATLNVPMAPGGGFAGIVKPLVSIKN